MEGIRIDQVPSNLLLVLFIIIFCLFFILEVSFFMYHQSLEFHNSLYMSFAMVTSVSSWKVTPHLPSFIISQIGFGDYAPVYNEDVVTLVFVSLVQFLPFVLQAAIVGELVKKMEKGRRGWRFSNANTLEVIRKV